MKLLSDKGDMERLYGKIAIGFLIVQDFIVILILMVISSFSTSSNITQLVFKTILEGVGLLVLLFLVGIYILPRVTKRIAKSHEFLLLFSLGWCLALSALFHYLNFSMEIGAILAGITLSSSPYRYEIYSRMRQLRDFFIVLFFILLGSQMTFSNIGQNILPITILSAFVLIGNPLIVMLLMGFLGYTKRNSFLAGLTVAQISEFSVILVALGIKLGHLSGETLSFVTAVGLITIAGSSYMIIYANKIYPHLSQYLGVFERKGGKVDEHKYHKQEKAFDVILIGYDHIGYDLLKSFKKNEKKLLIVDYDPEVIVGLAKEGVPCLYGDITDSEILNDLNLSKAKMIVSTIPDFDTNMYLINRIRQSNENAIVFVVSHEVEEAMKLYEKGANYVIMPNFLGGYHACTLIEKHGFDVDKFLEEKILHIKDLKDKKHVRHKITKHTR